MIDFSMMQFGLTSGIEKTLKLIKGTLERHVVYSSLILNKLLSELFECKKNIYERLKYIFFKSLIFYNGIHEMKKTGNERFSELHC